MNQEQLNRMQHDHGFIAALDQSGGSTPAALKKYGVDADKFNNESEMYRLIHEMRTRIIKSPAFDQQHILGSILFKQTMRSQIDGMPTTQYLWEQKRVVPILKIDNGLADPADGVQMMKTIDGLDQVLAEAKQNNVFGTKMRSFITEDNQVGIAKVIEQQFEYARRIADAGFVPIIEPEVSINADQKADIEDKLYEELASHLDTLAPEQLVMIKITIPTKPDLYQPLMSHPNVVRVVALSGGYTEAQANKLLAENHGLIASFNRGLSEGLSVDQTDIEFNTKLQKSIEDIYQASTT